jgi:hypothetical protein
MLLLALACARRPTSHSSFCSVSRQAARPSRAASLGRMSTTSVHRPISRLTRSRGFVERSFDQCSAGMA